MFRTTVVLALTAAIAVAPAAGAATKNGITPVAPKAGKSVPAGKSPKFKMRVRGSGQVWVHVCASAKKDADGVICSTASIGQAKKSGSLFVYTPKFFDFPEFWLNTPGTYHWQAHRIACEGGDTSDCKQEGPIVTFKVK